MPIARILMMTFAALLLTLTACQKDNVRSPYAIRTDPLAGGYPQNIALDGLHEALVVGRPIVEHATADKPLRVTVPLRSVADHTLRVQHRFTLLDSAGRPVKANREAWRHQVIAPRAEVFLETSALDTDAVDWRLEVRTAH